MRISSPRFSSAPDANQGRQLGVCYINLLGRLLRTGYLDIEGYQIEKEGSVITILVSSLVERRERVEVYRRFASIVSGELLQSPRPISLRVYFLYGS